MRTLFLLALLPAAAHAATVNINPGDDIITLTSSLGPGDEVLIGAGTYDIEGTLVWSGAGTESEPIVIKAQGGEAIIRQTVGSTIVRIEDASFVEVQGLKFETTDDIYDANRVTGIDVQNSTDVTLRNNHLRHLGGTAIYVGGSTGEASERVTIEHNHIEDIRDGSGIYLGCNDVACTVHEVSVQNNWVHDGGTGTGIYLAHGAQGCSVEDNVVYQMASWGLQTQSTSFGDSNVIERNVFWSVSDGIRAAGPSEVRNNLVFLTDGYGIRVENNSRDEFSDVHVSHNTVYGTGDDGIRLDNWLDREGMVLANNVVANTAGRAFDADFAEVADHGFISGNVFSGLVENLEAGTGAYIPGGGESDFMDAENWDFYPTSASILLSAADPAGDAYIPSDDFNLVTRDGGAPTVGAYEWVTEGNPGWAIREAYKELTTVDVNGEEVGGCCNKDPEAAEAGLLMLPLVLLVGLRRREEDTEA
ncbi:MAG: right-handed parallel beta-helix repeat-containing protein [Proteobacteria bacterium]|nr:right-handed parallel beta-helix repeat-containing protein [Pseudomonadota bacterium]